MRPIVSYIRVSTGKQGKSGLGIEAQRDAIARFAAAEGLEVLSEFAVTIPELGRIVRSAPRREENHPWTVSRQARLQIADRRQLASEGPFERFRLLGDLL